MNKNKTLKSARGWRRHLALGAVLLGVGTAALTEAQANSGLAWNTKNGAWWVLSSGAPTQDLEHTAVNRLWSNYRIRADSSRSFRPIINGGWSAIAINKKAKRIGVSLNKQSRAAAISEALNRVGARGGEIRATWLDYGISRQMSNGGEGRNY